MASLFASKDKCVEPGTNQTMFNADISKWNVVGVSNMAVIFSNARAFGQDVAKWDVRRVASMTGRAPPVRRCT
jgi:hypothetical protein